MQNNSKSYKNLMSSGELFGSVSMEKAINDKRIKN